MLMLTIWIEPNLYTDTHLKLLFKPELKILTGFSITVINLNSPIIHFSNEFALSVLIMSQDQNHEDIILSMQVQ